MLTQTCLGTLVNQNLCSCIMKHTLPVRAVVEGSAHMMACDSPAPDVSWHLKAVPKRLAAFRETQPWFTGRLSSVTFRVGLNTFKGLFQSDSMILCCTCWSSGCAFIPSHHLIEVHRKLIWLVRICFVLFFLPLKEFAVIWGLSRFRRGFFVRECYYCPLSHFLFICLSQQPASRTIQHCNSFVTRQFSMENHCK